MLNAEQMRLLPQCFKMIADPRRSQGRRHCRAVLGGAAGRTIATRVVQQRAHYHSTVKGNQPITEE
jgi:hypothetical protein